MDLIIAAGMGTFIGCVLFVLLFWFVFWIISPLLLGKRKDVTNQFKDNNDI